MYPQLVQSIFRWVAQKIEATSLVETFAAAFALRVKIILTEVLMPIPLGVMVLDLHDIVLVVLALDVRL